MTPDGLILAVSSVEDGSMTRSNPGYRARFLLSLDLDPARLATCEQVHGTRVGEVVVGGMCPRADGMRTRLPGLPLMILGADCPLLCLYDPETPAVAVAHAGWRGLAAGILQALEPRRGMLAFLAPCAGPCCYEVGEEVASRFPAEAVIPGTVGRNPHLDLKRATELALGLPVTLLGPACTICTDSHFSYRRSATTSRHALVAALR